MDKKIESGFSLIEFIIMISIISLIMIAIVSSKNIFNTSQVKMLAQEVINLKNDFGNFKLKYHQFPGDLQNASEIFNKSSATDFR